MSWLSFEAFARQAQAFDALVSDTPEVDRFCTSSLWTVPAQSAFAPHAEPFIHVTAESAVAMMIVLSMDGVRVATPLEAAWGLAAPLAGADPSVAAEHLRWVIDHAARPPEAFFISGIPMGGRWMNAIARTLSHRYRLGLGPDCGRRTTPTFGGLEGYLASRSAKFRAEMRRARRKAAAAGLTYVVSRPTDRVHAGELLEQAMHIEGASWKGLAHEGVNEGAARRFYELMVGDLAERGALRFLFTQLHGRAIGFLFGGVFGDTFRGLQMSYRAEHRALSPGNLMQLEMVEQLGAEGVAIYDLGTEMPYKKRWAEVGLETVTLALLPR